MVVEIPKLSHGRQILIRKRASLSGGQRQRVALACALYTRPEVLILDDILSGLDEETKQTIHTRVIGPEGLCRRHGMTTVLTSHSRKL